jgi:hypothetical protein
MQNLHNKPVKVKTTWTRAEVAEMFGICTVTLHGWLEERKYKLRPRKAITIKELDEIFAIFGDPRPYIEAERAKLIPQKGK